MGKEVENQQDLEQHAEAQIEIVFIDAGRGKLKKAVMYRSPAMLSNAAWREILTHQVEAAEPSTFAAMQAGSGEPKMVNFEEFHRAKYYEPEQLNNFLGVVSTELRGSKIVMQAGE